MCLNYRCLRASARAAAELNLQVLGRGLAPIGDLFVFDGLSFIEGRQSGLLHCRDMNKHVLPPGRGLDESIALGRVEPLDRTFSHYVVSAGSISHQTNRRSPPTVVSGGAR